MVRYRTSFRDSLNKFQKKGIFELTWNLGDYLIPAGISHFSRLIGEFTGLYAANNPSLISESGCRKYYSTYRFPGHLVFPLNDLTF